VSLKSTQTTASSPNDKGAAHQEEAIGYSLGEIPTAITSGEKKAPQNGSFPGGRYLWERSVTIPWRSITHTNTDRKKVLQTGALMRGASHAGGTLRRLLGTSFFLPRPPQRPGLFRAALSTFVAEDHFLWRTADRVLPLKSFWTSL
jgi:hypothetical protein